jgi:hypothetical protein
MMQGDFFSGLERVFVATDDGLVVEMRAAFARAERPDLVDRLRRDELRAERRRRQACEDRDIHRANSGDICSCGASL